MQLKFHFPTCLLHLDLAEGLYGLVEIWIKLEGSVCPADLLVTCGLVWRGTKPSSKGIQLRFRPECSICAISVCLHQVVAAICDCGRKVVETPVALSSIRALVQVKDADKFGLNSGIHIHN